MSETRDILPRSLPPSFGRRIVLSLLVVASAVVVWPGLARADGDPASDVLVSQNAFIPWDAGAWDAGAKPSDQARLEAVLARAAGHSLPATIVAQGGSPGSGSGGTDKVSWIVFVAGAVLIAVAWAASLHARPLRGGDRGASSA